MQEASERIFQNFEQSFKDFAEATDLTRRDKATKLSSQIDVLSLTRDGLTYLYQKSSLLDEAGIFEGTAWNEPDKLVATLVKGTLKAGHPTSSFEILSELRLLAYARADAESSFISAREAQDFLEEVVVHNLEFALKEPTEETRSVMSERELKKAYNLFGFIVSEIDLHGVYSKLAQEIKLICEQRPIVTRKARELIRLVDQRFDTSGDSEIDRQVRHYIHAVSAPTVHCREYESTEAYTRFLESCNPSTLEAEADAMGHSMSSTGLVSKHHAALLKFLAQKHPELVPNCLDLNDRGIAEWEKFHEFVTTIILEVVSPSNAQCIYGLARMLGQNLFSRRPVRVGLENLRRIKLNSQVEKRILKSVAHPAEEVTALQYLLGGVIKVLGQPLGVGQGNNPTCQSARGISMWSQHAPAKLIDMIITVATQNNLVMRYENHDLTSNQLGKGLLEKLDYNLDPVSVILVPHLDKLYNEMMKRSSGRGEDPHKWVNPSMYGQWIQLGFASCYDYLSNSILDFEGFVRIFYASFHPHYNGGREMAYPNPVGIFITSSKGDMVGFHAVSLLRVAEDDQGQVRAYFLNPNNEGRQDWGQGIEPSVYGHGEKFGESSLPIHQFTARLYAFHYNPLDIKELVPKVPEKELHQVEQLARASWGKSYVWNQQIKLW
ncbi:hypothetical protein [Marinoscillum furvescens]|uniref:Uncharacterized protein n=1 Tax=Marinoscillum furvescens DSM 4134 TaxID=1122208 RepID=A0A3D9L3S1_MARFU|nr:hypothetical protein [Marinoscillum furvescens]REE00111.1 hypothetical protein C7460_10648 [Marinoscillum furvescens DSM 4134]